MHVTGDLAINTVVDAFVDANTAAPRPKAGHYVIHGDFVRMDEFVGEHRYQWPVRSSVKAGVTVGASSDAPRHRARPAPGCGRHAAPGVQGRRPTH